MHIWRILEIYYMGCFCFGFLHLEIPNSSVLLIKNTPLWVTVYPNYVDQFDMQLNINKNIIVELESKRMTGQR